MKHLDRRGRHPARNAVLAALLALAPLASAGAGAAKPAAAPATHAEKRTLALDSLRTFAAVFAKIKSDYVEPVDDRKLLEYAIRGMLEGLDPHSTYLNEDDFAELHEGASGEFGGLGIEVGMEDGFVKVVTPIDDTPAQRAGIKPGDLISRIDDTPVKGMSLGDAVKAMRGEAGTEITLTVVREGVDKPLKFTLVRERIKAVSVKGRLLEPGYAYVRLSQFQSRTTDDLTAAIEKLKRESKGGLKGLILDLRNNPGGILNAAVSISDAFLTDGLIVYTEGRQSESRLEFSAGPDDIINGAPMVVLVNEGSASASEIVAGALQDRKRALIMGAPTFGKGSVQTVINIGPDTGIKLTTARYYTPSGRSIQAEGIKPDVTVASVTVSPDGKASTVRLKEADLMRHLSNGNKKGGKEQGAGGAKGEESGKSLVEEDFALGEALNMLKGLVIFGRRGG